jgi:hypothetical protein
MRASRAVSLSVLTLGLTIGGISAAAADAADSNSTVTTAKGTTSNFAYSSDNAYGSDSITTSAEGVTADQSETGVSPNGTGYDDSSTLWVNADGVGHSSTHSYTRGDQDKGDHHGNRGWLDQRWFHHDCDHDGLLSDVPDNLL